MLLVACLADRLCRLSVVGRGCVEYIASYPSGMSVRGRQFLQLNGPMSRLTSLVDLFLVWHTDVCDVRSRASSLRAIPRAAAPCASAAWTRGSGWMRPGRAYGCSRAPRPQRWATTRKRSCSSWPSAGRCERSPDFEGPVFRSELSAVSVQSAAGGVQVAASYASDEYEVW